MSNAFLPSRYDELIQTLAVGIEPVDACRGSRVAPPLFMVRDVAVGDDARLRLRDERRHVTQILPSVGRSNTCRFKLLYSQVERDATDPFVRVRLVQGFNDFAPRHFVPRRLEIPLIDPVVADTPVAGRVEVVPRIYRPALFPGADYPVHDSVTALRGRVERNGKPMPWARIQATRAPGNVIVGRAHGDDRGEFLLLLDSNAAAPGGGTMRVRVRVSVFGRDPALVSPSALEAATDPQWNLPVEQLPIGTAVTDSVSTGEDLPAPYTKVTSRTVTLRLGVLSSETDPFVIT